MFIAGNGRYYLSTDPRMKYPMNPIHNLNYLMETLCLYPVICPYLLILCQNSDRTVSVDYKTLEEVKTWKKFKIRWLKADHHVHLIEPEKVAPIIADFLLKSESKL